MAVSMTTVSKAEAFWREGRFPEECWEVCMAGYFRGEMV